MTPEFEGLGAENHWDLYDLEDYWFHQEKRINSRSPKIGKKLVAWTQVSPSQIENYIKCKRAWFFKSVARIPEPQKGHQALGTSFHLIMEKVPKGLSWPVREDTNATEEEWDKANSMANIALPLLPSDVEGKIKREHGIVLETYEGGPLMKGYIDLAIPPGIGWPSFLIPTNEAIIGDYKTLSDFRYMKTPEELASSIQMMSYAKWAITDWPSGLVGATDPLPEHVRLLHIYARTKAPFNRSSIRHESAVVSVPEINAFWNKTLDIIREMQSTATCQSGDDVEANGAITGHCEAYGGCHFRDKCGLAKESGIKTLFQIGKKPASTTPTPTSEDMSGSPILQKILAARAAAQGTNPNTQTQATNQPEQGQASPTPAPAAATISPVTVSVTQGNSASTGGVSSNGASAVNGDGSAVAVTGSIQPKGPISGLMAKIEAQGKGTPQLGGSVAQAYGKEMHGSPMQGVTGTGELGKGPAIMTVGELMKLASGIVPPDAPPRTQSVITTPGMTVADPEAEPAATTEEGEEDESVSTPTNVATPTASSPATLPVSQPQTQTVVDGAKKRGRPSKEEIAAREAAEKAAFEARVEAAVAERLAGMGALEQGSRDASLSQRIAELESALSSAVAERASAVDIAERYQQDAKAWEARYRANQGSSGGSTHSGRSEDGLTLYVDTLPVKGEAEVTDFYEWIAPAAQAVAEANSVADWRLINYTGKGLLASQIRELIKLTGLPKVLVIPSFAAGADVALEILSPQAKRIIRPLR